MKKYLIAPISLLLCASPLTAQHTQRLTAEKHNEYGLVYSLPKTALAITVTAECKRSWTGPFANYTGKYLGTDRVVTEDRTEWSVTSVSVTPYGIADDYNQYLMQLKPGSPTFICVANDGMLLSVNTDSEIPENIDTALRHTEKLASYNPDEYLQYVNEDFLSSKSVAKQAQMLAESIMEVRDAKIALTRGTADNMPADGSQLEVMLKSLAEQEETMTRAFTGYSTTEVMSATYTYIPDKEGRSVLCRLSDFDGLTDAEDLAGDPIYISLQVTKQPEMPVDKNGEEKKIPRDAVMYRIPGEGEITLSFRGRDIYSDTMEMAQYGIDFGLNPSLFTDRKSPSFATFNPVTGELMKIGPVSELDR